MNNPSFSLPLVIDEIRNALYTYFEHHEKFHTLLGKFSADFVEKTQPAKENPAPDLQQNTIEIELKNCLSRLHFSNERFSQGLQKLNDLLNK